MKIKLDCSNKYKDYFERLFKSNGHSIDDDGQVILMDNPRYAFQEIDPLTDHRSIAYIEAFGDDVFIHTTHNQTPKKVKTPLYMLEELLKDKGFIRVNKSQIVNIVHIKTIDPCIGQKYILTLKNRIYIDVNRTYYKSFKHYLNL